MLTGQLAERAVMGGVCREALHPGAEVGTEGPRDGEGWIPASYLFHSARCYQCQQNLTRLEAFE